MKTLSEEIDDSLSLLLWSLKPGSQGFSQEDLIEAGAQKVATQVLRKLRRNLITCQEFGIELTELQKTRAVELFSVPFLGIYFFTYELQEAFLETLVSLCVWSWLAEFPSTWEYTKDFLFENYSSNDVYKIKLCGLCLCVLSNISVEIPSFKQQLGRSVQLRAAMDRLCERGARSRFVGTLCEDMATMCQSMVRENDSTVIIDGEITEFFAFKALDILKIGNHSLTQIAVSDCFQALYVYTKGVVDQICNYNRFSQKLLSQETFQLILNYARSPDQEISSSSLKLFLEMTQMNSAGEVLFNYGIVNHLQEILESRQLHPKVLQNIVPILYNLCEISYYHANTICERNKLIVDVCAILTYCSNPRVVTEIYHFLCFVVQGVENHNIKKLYLWEVPKILLQAGGRQVSDPDHHVIFNALARFYQNSGVLPYIKSDITADEISQLYGPLCCPGKNLILEFYTEAPTEIDLENFGQLTLFNESIEDVMHIDSLELGASHQSTE